jgi:hypothetical protein
VLHHVNSRLQHHTITTKPWEIKLNIAWNGYVVHSIFKKWFEILNKIPNWLRLVKILQVTCNFRGISLHNHHSKLVFLICWQMLNPWQICKIINRTSPFHTCISDTKKLQSTYHFYQLCGYIIVHVLSCCLLITEDQGHFMWDLWCTRWYRGRSFLEYLAFLLSIQFQQRFLFYSYINCVKNNWCNFSCIFPWQKKSNTISSINCYINILFISLLNS